jgi:hypothetical protein
MIRGKEYQNNKGTKLAHQLVEWLLVRLGFDEGKLADKSLLL